MRITLRILLYFYSGGLKNRVLEFGNGAEIEWIIAGVLTNVNTKYTEKDIMCRAYSDHNVVFF